MVKGYCHTEESTKAAWLATRGVAIAGWGVSMDCTDINSRAANFTFAGTEASRKWFDKQKTNLMAFMSEFEIQVGYVIPMPE